MKNIITGGVLAIALLATSTVAYAGPGDWSVWMRNTDDTETIMVGAPYHSSTTPAVLGHRYDADAASWYYLGNCLQYQLMPVELFEELNNNNYFINVNESCIDLSEIGGGSQALSFISYASTTLAGLANVASTGSYNDLTDKPVTPEPYTQIHADWTQASTTHAGYIENKPILHTVATSGAYSDLSGTPTLHTVATTGDYNDLENLPNLLKAVVATTTVSGGSGNATIDISSYGFTEVIDVDWDSLDNTVVQEFGNETKSTSSVSANVKRQEFTGVSVLGLNVLGSVQMNNAPNGAIVRATIIGR